MALALTSGAEALAASPEWMLLICGGGGADTHCHVVFYHHFTHGANRGAHRRDKTSNVAVTAPYGRHPGTRPMLFHDRYAGWYGRIIL